MKGGSTRSAEQWASMNEAERLDHLKAGSATPEQLLDAMANGSEVLRAECVEQFKSAAGPMLLANPAFAMFLVSLFTALSDSGIDVQDEAALIKTIQEAAADGDVAKGLRKLVEKIRPQHPVLNAMLTAVKRSRSKEDDSEEDTDDATLLELVNKDQTQASEALREAYITLARNAIPNLGIDKTAGWETTMQAIQAAKPEWFTEGTTPLDITRKLEQEIERKGKTRKSERLPQKLSQQTFREARNAAIAIADGPTGRRWEEVQGETALRHVIDGEPIQTKLMLGPSLQWWGLPTTYASLREELRRLGPQGVLLYQISIGLTLEKQHATVELDDLIRALGWTPRSRKERFDMRLQVFRWLSIFDSLTLHGKRPEKYKDRMTKEVLDLTTVGKLVMISEAHYAGEQMSLDGSEPPVMVTLTAGPWLDRFRDNKQVLQHFGNVRKLAELPCGKPSGAWALSVGLALNQLWRERSARAEVLKVGEDKHPTVLFERPFTRYELLNMFRAEPWVEEILRGNTPNRAQTYWKEAIALLKRHGVVGHYREVDAMPLTRKGWQNFWLNQQRLDIRPKAEEMKVVADISRKQSDITRRLTRKRGTGAT